MTMRGKGDLCGFTLFNETAYGTAGTTKTFGGVLYSLETPSEETIEYDQACGSRQWENMVRTMENYGWKAEFTMPSGTPTNWTQWFTFALGGLTGTISNDLNSFSALFRIASNEHMDSCGCKVNSLTMSADAMGAPIKFNVEAMAKKNTFASGQGSPLARPSTAPITYSSLWTRNGSSLAVKSWSLNIANNLVGDPGIDSSGFGLAAGSGSTPGGQSDITLDLTISSVDSTFDILKQGNATNDTLVLTMDGYTVTCTGCYMKSDYPTRGQAPYDETISYIVKGVTIAAVSSP